MAIISIIGSPNKISRSARIIDYIKNILNKNQIFNKVYSIRDFAAEDVFYANFKNERINQFIKDINEAEGVIIATPIYKAAFSGVLKTLLDLLPQDAFRNKVILPFANAGSKNYLLALDYSLKPVLSSMKASEIISGVIAKDAEISYDDSDYFVPELKQRIDEAIIQFLKTLHRTRINNFPDFLI